MSELSKPRIVCAANQLVFRDPAGQVRKVVIAGARHCDSIMNPIRNLLTGADFTDPRVVRDGYEAVPDDERRGLQLPGQVPGTEDHIDEVQGFIDQHGNFYTRAEAFVIASENGQLIKVESWNATGKLYSENLY